MQNGKGDKPRNCFSQQFRDNYDEIFSRKEKNAFNKVLLGGVEFTDCGNGWVSAVHPPGMATMWGPVLGFAAKEVKLK